MTGYLSLQVRDRIDQDAVEQFAFTSDQVTLKVRERLGAYALILKGGAGLFAGSGEVSRAEWKAYVDKLRANDSIPGVQGIGYAKLIRSAQLAGHVGAIRSEGFPDYSVRPAGDRPLYSSIIYLEPFSGRNLRAFGYDMYAEPVRRAAMELARDTGDAALSGKVELVQETGKDVQAGTLMYVPVYRNGARLDTVDDRRSALVGWTYSPYRMQDLMEGILPGWTSHEGKVIDLHIFDGSVATAGNLLFDSSPASAHHRGSVLSQQRTIDFGGRKWLLVLDPIDGAAGISYLPAWATLLGGVVLSSLLFGLMVSLASTRVRAEAMAANLTKEIRSREDALRESESRFRTMADTAPVLIWTSGHDGQCNWFNKVWLDFTGRTLGQETGNGWTAGIHPDDIDRHLETCSTAFGARRSFVVEYRLRRFDGEYRWLTDNGVPRFDERGAFLGYIGSCIDITERKHADARWRFAIEGAGDGLWDWDVPGGKVFFSTTWKSMLGYADAEIGDGLDEWSRRVHPDDMPKVMADVQAHLDGKVPAYVNEHRVLCKDGGWKWVLDRGLVIERDKGGQPLRVIGTHTDITARKLADEQLEQYRNNLEQLVAERTADLAQARDAANAANIAKSIFLANMSHELRTPMNGIMGMIDLVRRRVTDPQQLDWLNKGMDSAKHLLHIINDILDISKIESDRLVLEEQDFSLRQAIDDVLQMQDLTAHAKNLRLVSEIDPLIPFGLRGDPMRVKQILLNYMSNAIKFSDRGLISINARLVEESGQEVVVRIEVVDQGIGLNAEQQARLFHPFVQADGSTTRRYGGTGLGLIISKRLAGLMGGEVGVSSQPNAGSRFWATIRLRRCNGRSPASANPEEASSLARLSGKFAGARILLAEDEPINREVLISLLDDAGLSVVSATNGREALEQIRLGGVALVLMDVQMPVMNGLEATRAIRHMPGMGRLPILALTANAFDDDRQRCLDAGMNDHIGKPVEPEVLYSIILRWLRSSLDRGAA